MNEHYHFIGIGGIGMGALASLLLAKGYRVSGSDLKENELTRQLQGSGATVHIGHDPKHLEGADRVVFSSAIPDANPEMIAARAQQVRLVRRAELLAELMQEHTAITVAGAHGKTTTTSMIAHILMTAELHPTVAVGGIVMDIAANARLGSGRYFVAEVDESDRSFLHFQPSYSVITNIDLEHVDEYKSWAEIIDAYARFIRGTRENGIIFGCGEDPILLEVLQNEKRPFKTYGFSNACDIFATDLKHDAFSTSFICHLGAKELGPITLEVPGRHNVLNALAATGIALSLGVDVDVIRRALRSFRGVKRRFQQKGEVNNILIIDDYAHHPTEIAATLAAARGLKRERLLAVFQPHRYSRVEALFGQFVKCLLETDYLIVTDIYAASEQPIEGVNAVGLVERIRALTRKPAVYLKKEEIISHLADIARPGDLIMTLGAGDITYLSDQLGEALRNAASAKVEKVSSGQ